MQSIFWKISIGGENSKYILEKQMTEPLISVIVPCYNVEKYLPQCVDSIMGQTYRNLEIILVDDGSPDRCGEICDEYAATDSRIRVIHKPNGGLADARNVAIDIAKGCFLSFVDSDDFISPFYIEGLYQIMEETDSDISACSYIKVEEGRMSELSTIAERKHSYVVWTRDSAIREMFYQKSIEPTAWGKLFRREVFEGVRYPKGKLYEDWGCIFDLLVNCRSVAYTRNQWYCYLLRKNSILGRFNPNRLDILDLLDSLELRLRNERSVYLKSVVSRNLSAHFNILGLMVRYHMEDKTNKHRCWDYICKNRIACLFDRQVRMKNKIAIVISFWGYRPLLFFLKRIKR